MAWSRDQMVERAAAELRPGETVNLGIGIPTQIPKYVSDEQGIVFHSENGMLGIGHVKPGESPDLELMNAGKESVTAVPGTSFFDSALSFSMIRGGHIDVAVLGAYQVSESGDLANWLVPGKQVRGIGGAMDLVIGAKRLIVLMEQLDPAGASKLVKECSLPLTGSGVVDTVITDRAVFDVHEGSLYLRELAPNETLDSLRASTEASFHVGEVRIVENLRRPVA